jgi:outer membrane receptor protein involved in Fe transport
METTHRRGAARSRRARLLLSALPWLLPAAALGQNASEQDPLRLPRITAEADRAAPEAARLADEVPSVRIPRAVFDTLPSERASDILPRLPGVVTSGPPGEAKSFGLRGLTPDYTRVQVDGLQLPSGAQGRALELMNLPGFLLEEVGILRNPDASTDSDGIGGRVSLRLRALPQQDVTEVRLAAGGRDSLFDGRHFTTSALMARRFGEGFGVMGAVTLDRRQIIKVKDFSERTFQGGPGGAGQLIDESEPRDSRNLDAFLNLGWQWDGGQLTVRPFLFDETLDNARQRDTYRRLNRQLISRTKGEGDERLTLGGTAISLRQALGSQVTMEMDAAFSLADFNSENTTRVTGATGAFSEASRERSRIDDQQYDLGLRFAWRPPALPGHELRTGVQVRHLSRDSDADLFTLDAQDRVTQTATNLARSRDADYTASETYLAGFVQDRWTIGRLTISPGLRLEQVQLDLAGSQGSSTPGYTDVLPSLPAVFRLTDTLSLRGAVSRQVNRPSLQELAPGFTVRGPRSYYGNPDLEPARSWSWDAGVEYATRDVFLSAGVFLRQITDVVEAAEVATNTYNYSNVGNGRVKGLEFEQRLGASLLGMPALAPLTLRLNQTFLDSRVNDPATGPRRFSEVPRFVGNAGLEWNDRQAGTVLAANVTYTSTRLIRSYQGSGSQLYKEINPTTFLDLSAQQRVAPGVVVFGTAQNLLNQNRDEFEMTDDILSRRATIDSGRTFFVGVRISL